MKEFSYKFHIGKSFSVCCNFQCYTHQHQQNLGNNVAGFWIAFKNLQEEFDLIYKII